MADSEFYIYVLFRENGVPFYVGKGKGPRWERHHLDRENFNRHKLAIIRRMRAMGLSIPKIKLHEGLTEVAAYAYEVALIAAIGRADKGRGPLTNLTDGGEGRIGSVCTLEHRARISAALQGKKRGPPPTATRAKIGAANQGKKRSAEWRAQKSASMQGTKRKPHTPEARAKISAALVGRKCAPFSEEHRANLSARAKVRPFSEEYRASLSAAAKARTRGPSSRFV
jgi:LEM-3-like GIY-YIG domain/NUMOD3 motif